MPPLTSPSTLIPLTVLALLVGVGSAPSQETDRSPVVDSAFWAHWGDGKAELSGYSLRIPRYGQNRDGVAVFIFVNEEFSLAERVKSDGGGPDVYPVLKLNLAQDFQTGLYDYNLMTSTFITLEEAHGRPAGTPTKVSFSSQEWCGHVYQQLLFDAEKIRQTTHSYFGGEADSSGQLDYPRPSLVEDAIWHWARGLAYPVLRRGESLEVPLLRSLQESRLVHVPLAWRNARLTRSAETTSVEVPAGTFECETRTVEIPGGKSWTILVEAASPHRIIRWTTSEGERGELVGSDRLAYWTLAAEGRESLLSRLGLKRRPPLSP